MTLVCLRGSLGGFARFDPILQNGKFGFGHAAFLAPKMKFGEWGLNCGLQGEPEPHKTGNERICSARVKGRPNPFIHWFLLFMVFLFAGRALTVPVKGLRTLWDRKTLVKGVLIFFCDWVVFITPLFFLDTKPSGLIFSDTSACHSSLVFGLKAQCIASKNKCVQSGKRKMKRPNGWYVGL